MAGLKSQALSRLIGRPYNEVRSTVSSTIAPTPPSRGTGNTMTNTVDQEPPQSVRHSSHRDSRDNDGLDSPQDTWSADDSGPDGPDGSARKRKRISNLSVSYVAWTLPPGLINAEHSFQPVSCCRG
jgi:hypothetical protein